VQQNRVPDELTHGGGDLRGERHGPKKVAVRVHRAKLQVGFGLRVRFAVAVGGDVAQQARPFQPVEFGPHRGYFVGGPEAGHGKPAVRAERSDLFVGEGQWEFPRESAFD
jgi:hypothetical protein